MQFLNSIEQRYGYQDSGGFSLIELLISIAIVGILSSIAYPQYTEMMQSSRRADGRLALLDAVQSIERCKAARYSYTGCLTDIEGTSSDGNYDITVSDTSATTFTITATGKNKQANDSNCGTLTINHLGARTPGEDTNCWPR